jgi:molybdopterin synthase catalytic subunit
MKILVDIQQQKLSYEDCLKHITDDALGGISIFDGRVRKANLGKSILYLDYECYKPMALKEMTSIAKEVQKQTNVERIYMAHRTGRVGLKESAVLIGTSSIHRAEAITATSMLIELLKERVPIWKKEHTTDGHVWINARP